MLRKDVTDLKKLRELVERTRPANVEVIRKFIDGDHWQGGTGWVGPMPAAGPDVDAAVASLVATETERIFTSANRIEEVSDRHASGLAGREPKWGLLPRILPDPGKEIQDSEKKEMAALRDAIKQWWDEHGIHEKIHAAAMGMAWGKRVVLRFYFPTGLLDNPPQEKELAVWLKRLVFLDVITAESGHVHEDPATKSPLGIILYKTDDEKDVTEVSYVDENGEDTYIEVQVGNDPPQKSDPLKLGGRTTMLEIRRRPLVNTQMIQQQKAHNYALTILQRNLTSSGFTERTVLNAAAPGHWEFNPDGSRKAFIPARLPLGAGFTAWLEGIETTDVVTGKTMTANPDIKYKEPSPVAPTLEAARATYETILEEAQQAHVLMNADAVASGRSRIEARKDYESSLRLTKPSLERAGRWVIETAIAIAEALMSNGDGTKTLAKYRAEFACRLDTGTLTAEDREQNNKDVESGTMPREAAIAANGTDDVEAAMAMIDSQTGVVLDDLRKRAEITELFTKAGASLEGAARTAGVPEELIPTLIKGATDVGSEDDEEDADDAPPSGEE
jgi:hypothetical protein